jgi:hypothetical protein
VIAAAFIILLAPFDPAAEMRALGDAKCGRRDLAQNRLMRWVDRMPGHPDDLARESFFVAGLGSPDAEVRMRCYSILRHWHPCYACQGTRRVVRQHQNGVTTLHGMCGVCMGTGDGQQNYHIKGWWK